MDALIDNIGVWAGSVAVAIGAFVTDFKSASNKTKALYIAGGIIVLGLILAILG